ncbi:MAG TPA: hypothetical protein VL972_05325 [Solirubrobacteraceae bacterium]|nr:hypothetical protein [Solirubrobacteraceae bacterium]
MYDYSDSSSLTDVCPPPPDVCLLLRAHAEQLWLTREIVPVLGQLHDAQALPEEQLGAALAYLEVAWLEASRLASETDAAYEALEQAVHLCAASRRPTASGDRVLSLQARRYRVAVLRLRYAIAARVRELIAPPATTEPLAEPEPAG